MMVKNEKDFDEAHTYSRYSSKGGSHGFALQKKGDPVFGTTATSSTARMDNPTHSPWLAYID